MPDREQTLCDSGSTKRVHIGGFCIKGGGHVWTYEDGPDGCSGWPIFIEIDAEDLHLFPDWVQDCYRSYAQDGFPL